MNIVFVVIVVVVVGVAADVVLKLNLDLKKLIAYFSI